MIQIEQFSMRLPSGFQHRAGSIARLVCKQLAKQSLTRDIVIESINIAPQRINVNTSDDEIALLIVRQIADHYLGGAR